MYIANTIGKATRVTGTGLQTITSVSGVNLIGILSCCSATATGVFSLFHGVTASSTACYAVFASGSVAQYLPMPAYLSGGYTINVPAIANPDFTLFWNPA